MPAPSLDLEINGLALTWVINGYIIALLIVFLRCFIGVAFGSSRWHGLASVVNKRHKQYDENNLESHRNKRELNRGAINRPFAARSTRRGFNR